MEKAIADILLGSLDPLFLLSVRIAANVSAPRSIRAGPSIGSVLIVFAERSPSRATPVCARSLRGADHGILLREGLALGDYLSRD
jgi:hypothetical protein